MIKRRGPRAQFQNEIPLLYPELVEEKVKNAKGDEEYIGLLTKNITFVVTENCNLRCSYCYECNKNYQAKMSKETAKKAVDMILDSSKTNEYFNPKENPFLILEFIGGEPLLEIDIIDYIADYFRYKTIELNHPWKNRYMLSITSNGMLYNSEKVRKFVEKNKGRLSISITIDGDKKLHDSCRVDEFGNGSYDTVVKALKQVKIDTGLDGTKVTFAPENIKYISESIPHLFDLGLHDISANCVFEDVWKPEHTSIFYKELIKLADYMIDSKIYQTHTCSIFDETIGNPLGPEDNRNWCGGNGQMLAIGTDGRLFPCIRFMKYSLSNKELPEFQIGTIDNGIDKEEDNEYLQCLCHIDRKSQSTEECFNCSVAQGCAWCTGNNYDKFGTPNKRATFICGTHKARVLANYYFWNKLYKLEGENRKFGLHLSKEDIDMITEGKGIPEI